MLLAASLAVVARAQRHILSSEELRPEYDFIIVGGGTSGLTVADRLRERLVNRAVLAIEFGKVEYAPGTFDPPQTVWGRLLPRSEEMGVLDSCQPRSGQQANAAVFAGVTAGGSSAINGMFFDRPSSFDFDAWAHAGSPEAVRPELQENTTTC